MENNNQNLSSKSNGKKGTTGLLVFIIVILLIIISIGAGWFLAKNEELFGKKEEQKTNSTSNVVEAVESKTGVTKNETVKEMTAEERYAIYSKGVQKSIEAMGKNVTEQARKDLGNPVKLYYNTLHSTEEFPLEGIYLNDKKEVFVITKQSGDDIKIFNNAINCGICPSGNGGTLYVIWAIDTNGDLYTQTYDVMDTANKMKFNLSKNQGLKNTISVIQCASPSAVYAVAVDIDGNTTNL